MPLLGNQVVNWLKDIFIRIGTAIGAFLAGFFAGKLKAENKELEKTVEAMRDAKDIKHRVDTDPAYRKSVRDKYR